ncbi:hypothetical protein LLG96_03895 [bacterium]|nr:hypothetical protein [bacterium]
MVNCPPGLLYRNNDCDTYYLCLRGTSQFYEDCPPHAYFETKTGF